MAQIVEQIIRMGAVFLIADILKSSGQELTVELAVTGHLIGELASCFYTAFFRPKAWRMSLPWFTAPAALSLPED